MKFRNLETVRQIVKEATGLDIMYAYEDLVFPEHAAFMIQFDDANPKNLFCHFHMDCNPNNKTDIFSNLKQTASNEKITIEEKGFFKLQQKGEQVEILFR